MLPKAMAYAVVAGVLRPRLRPLRASPAARRRTAGAHGPRPIYFFTVLALLVALFLGPLFAYLPRFALAAVVIMAVARLFDLRQLLALCRADTLDALVVLTTFAVTLVVGPERGILAGVAAAWLCYLFRTRRVPVHERLWRPAGASEDGGL